MKEISMTFSQEEMEILIQRVFVGEYILSSDEEMTDKRGYALLQKILNVAQANKMVKNIECDELDGQYLIPYGMEEELITTLDEYNEDIFVDSLVDELVQNEMESKYAPRLIANMNEETYERLSTEIVEKYEKEFEMNGYKNLCIKGASSRTS